MLPGCRQWYIGHHYLNDSDREGESKRHHNRFEVLENFQSKTRSKAFIFRKYILLSISIEAHRSKAILRIGCNNCNLKINWFMQARTKTRTCSGPFVEGAATMVS
jgi:hypothetical protein